MVQAKKVALYLVVVFVLYVIISDPDTAGEYVKLGFRGVSDGASAVGDFMTWIANGGNS
ncbi:hypothetical protein [Streptomyces albidoflavus]|uniref:hypothetical protein n=1 Tax=Streptomyces albidoflavus TaxID=1886 RepID=UPI0033C8EB04